MLSYVKNALINMETTVLRETITRDIRQPLRCRRVRFMLATPNTTNTHKSLFYEILQQPNTTITTNTTGSLTPPLPPILPVVI